jgi:hypothetical protein
MRSVSAVQEPSIHGLSEYVASLSGKQDIFTSARVCIVVAVERLPVRDQKHGTREHSSVSAHARTSTVQSGQGIVMLGLTDCLSVSDVFGPQGGCLATNPAGGWGSWRLRSGHAYTGQEVGTEAKELAEPARFRRLASLQSSDRGPA